MGALQEKGDELQPQILRLEADVQGRMCYCLEPSHRYRKSDDKGPMGIKFNCLSIVSLGSWQNLSKFQKVALRSWNLAMGNPMERGWPAEIQFFADKSEKHGDPKWNLAIKKGNQYQGQTNQTKHQSVFTIAILGTLHELQEFRSDASPQ